MTKQDSSTCEVCERSGKVAQRCRFEVGCSCWYGVPCDPPGASMRTMQRKLREVRRTAVNGSSGIPHRKVS